MGEMTCPKCGRSYSDDLLYCLDDGTALTSGQDEEPEAETVARPRIVIDPFASTGSHEYCPSCGTPNKVGSRFCKKCGQPLVDDVQHVVVGPSPPPVYQTNGEQAPRRSYTGIIAILCGGIGLLILVLI